MIENQRTIADWALQTFGPGTPERAAERAWEEMLEFNCAPSTREKLLEAADVIICLYVFAEKKGHDLHSIIDNKMAINRTRLWESRGDGTGYHK